MAAAHDKPGSGVVAILLITRSRPGPRLVFHYPETPIWKSSQNPHIHEPEDSDTESDEEQERPRCEDAIIASIIPAGARQVLNGDSTPSRTVLGRSVESLEKVLSPGRWCDGKKFEISLNGLTFVGHPVYAPEDYDWLADKPKQTKTPSKSNSKDANDMADLDIDNLNLTAPAPPSRSHPQHDFMHVPDSLESQTEGALGTSMQTTSSTGSDPLNEQIAMFHVVLVLGDRGRQGQVEAAAVYQGVVKKLSKALHYCQRQANYVTSETKRILALRSKARLNQLASNILWDKLVEGSELAWALKEVYDRLTLGGIIGIRLNGLEMSLQTNEKPEAVDQGAKLGPLSALLLLEPKENLLRELSHPDASPLATFIREQTATKNLQKHATYVGMPVDDILYLASHLIKWQKAKIITPLHQRNTYVVSPSAPITELAQHMEQYHKEFPTLPNLPNMLKVLSGKPIKYGLLIPSRDHRTAYMNILSYLIRNQFVVQLKTYGWLKLPHSLLDQTPAFSRTETLRRPGNIRSSLLSPRTRPIDEDALSESSERTALASPSTPFSQQGRRFSREIQISAQDEAKKKPETFAVITNPNAPKKEHAKLLEAFQVNLRDPELHEAFPRLLRHLDGEHAFEEIAGREGLKRAKVEEWLAGMEDKGHLMTVRYI